VSNVGKLSVEELAAFICQTLADAGITVVLTGGSCVAIWSEGKYVSKDLDFIEEGPVSQRQLARVLKTIGFEPRERYFAHPDTDYLLEFPSGPLMVGDERVREPESIKTSTGVLLLLSPTDCVKDRLAAFFHWNDRQALTQARLVAKARSVRMDEIRAWSLAEGHLQKFKEFAESL